MNNVQKLYEMALKCRQNAHAPYSQFKVGACVLSINDKFYAGCNVENASYPCGTCAEAGAISAMIADGETQIAQILIVADTKMILPCGNCMQKIAEFANADTLIHSADLQQINRTFSLNEILPKSFQAKDITNAK